MFDFCIYTDGSAVGGVRCGGAGVVTEDDAMMVIEDGWHHHFLLSG